MNNRIISPGVYGLVLLFLIGIWLVIAPFATETQPVGAAWQAATINDVAAGGTLIVASLLGVLASTAIALRSAVREKMVN